MRISLREDMSQLHNYPGWLFQVLRNKECNKQPLLQKYALGNVSLPIHQMIAVDVELQINHFVRSWSNRYLKQGQGTDSRRSSLETRIDYDRVHCQMTLASLLQHHSR